MEFYPETWFESLWSIEEFATSQHNPMPKGDPHSILLDSFPNSVMLEHLLHVPTRRPREKNPRTL